MKKTGMASLHLGIFFVKSWLRGPFFESGSTKANGTSAADNQCLVVFDELAELSG